MMLANVKPAGLGSMPEVASMHAGAWFADLPEPLRVAIVATARVQQVRAGAVLARRGDAAAQWIGVASGALRLGTALPDGRDFTLDFIGASQWYGDIALIDERPNDLDVMAHVPSTVLLVPKADLRGLVARFDEFGAALLRLNCQRLRHMLRRFEELQTLTLAARLARQLQRLGKQFGRVQDHGFVIEIGLSQADLAAMVGGSRQRVNRTLRQMQQHGIVEIGTSRVRVRDEARLQAVADGTLLPAAVDNATDAADDLGAQAAHAA